jgi:hypothetical protein
LFIVQYFLKHNVSETGFVSVFRCVAGDSYFVGSTKRTGLNELKQIQFPKSRVLKNTGSWTKSKTSIIQITGDV